MSKAAEIKTVPMELSIAIAEYDECGSDGLCIDGVVRFTDSLSAAKWLVEDYEKTVDPDEYPGEAKKLRLYDVHRSIAKLKPSENTQWRTPEDFPSWIIWKAFRH